MSLKPKPRSTLERLIWTINKSSTLNLHSSDLPRFLVGTDSDGRISGTSLHVVSHDPLIDVNDRFHVSKYPRQESNLQLASLGKRCHIR